MKKNIVISSFLVSFLALFIGVHAYGDYKAEQMLVDYVEAVGSDNPLLSLISVEENEYRLIGKTYKTRWKVEGYDTAFEFEHDLSPSFIGVSIKTHLAKDFLANLKKKKGYYFIPSKPLVIKTTISFTGSSVSNFSVKPMKAKEFSWGGYSGQVASDDKGNFVLSSAIQPSLYAFDHSELFNHGLISLQGTGNFNAVNDADFTILADSFSIENQISGNVEVQSFSFGIKTSSQDGKYNISNRLTMGSLSAYNREKQSALVKNINISFFYDIDSGLFELINNNQDDLVLNKLLETKNHFNIENFSADYDVLGFSGKIKASANLKLEMDSNNKSQIRFEDGEPVNIYEFLVGNSVVDIEQSVFEILPGLIDLTEPSVLSTSNRIIKLNFKNGKVFSNGQRLF